jgi:hemerythrin superfamily protein
MPDGFQLLERDHRAVAELFDTYEQTGDDAVAEQICFELTVHSEIEEQVLYPKLREFGDRTSELSDHAEAAHERVANYVGRIGLAEGDERLSLVEELWAEVDEHVREEETEIFPTMRDLGVDADALGRALETCKGEAVARSRGTVG